MVFHGIHGRIPKEYSPCIYICFLHLRTDELLVRTKEASQNQKRQAKAQESPEIYSTMPLFSFRQEKAVYNTTLELVSCS